MDKEHIRLLARDAALKLCQKIGISTMFTDSNNGYSLPKEIAKQIANITLDFGLDHFDGLTTKDKEYISLIRSEIEKL